MRSSDQFSVEGFPFLIAPDAPGGTLGAWMEANAGALSGLLTTHGALLFRDFTFEGGLDRVSSLFFDERLAYTYRSTPRTEVVQHVYTATEYPRQLSIPQHCENAYQRSWPLKLLFHCVTPAARGGCTPLADLVKVTADIDPAIRKAFAARGVRYVRNYRAGVDLPWEDVFRTRNKSEVERYCAESGLECLWTDGGLRTTQTCRALARHPITGQEVWFNQAHLFHVSALEPAQQKMMVEFFGEEGLPRAAYYGDGGRIEPTVLDHIRAAFERHQVRFTWRAGDLLLVDNMRASHGRDPYEGDRKVLVCMAEPYPADSPSAARSDAAMLTLNV